jgi:hypothetical protein
MDKAIKRGFYRLMLQASVYRLVYPLSFRRGAHFCCHFAIHVAVLARLYLGFSIKHPSTSLISVIIKTHDVVGIVRCTKPCYAKARFTGAGVHDGFS